LSKIILVLVKYEKLHPIPPVISKNEPNTARREIISKRVCLLNRIELESF